MNEQRTKPERYNGAPPTIGFLRRENGIERTRIYCAEVNCGRVLIVTFDALGLPDETPFPDVATRRRWVCRGCGCRRVVVMPDWPDPCAG